MTEKTHSIIDLLNILFPHDTLMDGTLIEESFSSPINNEFINSQQGDLYHFQTISSDFVIYITLCQSQNSYYYLLSPENSVGVHMPKTFFQLSRLHKHDYLELVYILQGELDFVIEGVHKRYHSGECCIINQNVRHVEEYTSDFCAIYFSLRQEFIESLHIATSDIHSSQLFQFLVRNTGQSNQIDYLDFYSTEKTHTLNSTQEIMDLLIPLLSELVGRQPGYLDIIIGYLKSFFYYIQSPARYICLNTRYYPKDSSDIFESTMAYINSHRYKITRAELSEALHYNGNYISEIFLKHTGITLSKYIRDICLKEAADLLLNTNLTTSEIIQKIGFQNRTAFYRQFEKRYKMSPGRYRKHSM